MKKTLEKIRDNPLFYGLLLVLIACVFLIQAFIYAHQMPSRVDEGSFLIKGYYYVKGIYKPFQDYGPWTNNMPLAYYIPGLAQVIFGPGLKTGRYFMIFIGLLNMAGMWLLIRRLKGKWWALVSLLMFALNPALIKIYVQAVSQVIVACFLTWALVFLIGEERNTRQIAIGAFLCALATLTRQNMIFLLPFVVLYAFLIFGKKAGWTALLWAAWPFLLVHLIFYPKIMALWYSWFPGFLKELFNINIVTGGGEQVWSPDVGLLTRFTSFFTAVRYYFIPLLGVLVCLLALPRKEAWSSKYERKTVFCLMVLFGVMFVMHAWASLAKNYCVYCFPNYLAFFISIAVLMAVLALSNLMTSKANISIWGAALIVIFFIAGSFLGSLETVGRWVMALQVPRFKGGRILPGSTELWKIFENRFGYSYGKLLPIIPVVFGVMVAALFLLLAWAAFRVLRRKTNLRPGNFILTALVILAFIFMPSPLLADMQTENTCGGDVLAAYEKVGSQLQELIPDGSSVYWAAGSVVTPLLYLTDTQYPPQLLNGIYSKRVGGDRETLEKAGYYNGESVLAWRSSADYVINSNTKMIETWLTFLNPDDFDEYRHTDALDPCDPTTFLRIFKKK